MRIKSARFFVYATDLSRSLQFYTQALRLQVVDRILGGTVLAAGPVELEVLQERREEDALMDRRTGFTIFVDDAENAYNELAQQNITMLTELQPAPDGSKVFYIADPDGLPIGILEEAPELPPPAWILGDQA